jgi:pimeloyl-ACP methyl ester carboxylesterase
MPNAAGLYYFAYGTENAARPPVILIHGAGGTHLHWPPQVRRLHGQRTFALDLPGHGKSGGLGKQSVGEYAQGIIGFMKATGLRSAIIVGHSMGSAIALDLALDYPRQVLALGLLGSGARLRVLPTILESAANPATYPTAVQMVTEAAYGPGANPRLKEAAAKRMRDIRSTVFHGDFLACNSFDVMGRLNQIRIPTLILCGGQDRMTPVRYAKYLHEHIPSSQLQIIEGAGHMLMLEQPDETARLFSDFLSKIPYQQNRTCALNRPSPVAQAVFLLHG